MVVNVAILGSDDKKRSFTGKHCYAIMFPVTFSLKNERSSFMHHEYYLHILIMHAHYLDIPFNIGTGRASQAVIESVKKNPTGTFKITMRIHSSNTTRTIYHYVTHIILIFF